MPFVLLKTYNQLLDIVAMSEHDRKISLMKIFDRDFTYNTNLKFRSKQITPTPVDGAIEMATLYTHLTTVITDEKTRHREFEMERSKRLHWVRFHIDESKKNNMLYFSLKEKEGFRTYIYDIDEKYVVVLEPKSANHYYLITAFYVQGKDAQRDKYMRKYERKLDELL
jgi:hypothetical protein